MDSENREPPQHLVRSSARGLTRTGADALVKRGLQDLVPHAPRWTLKWTAAEANFLGAISPLGLVAGLHRSAAIPDQYDSIRLYDPETGQRSDIEVSLPATPVDVLDEALHLKTTLAWSPCGKYFLCAQRRGLREDTQLHLYDANRRESVCVFAAERGHVSGSVSFAWSPKGKCVATVGEALRIWNIEFSEGRPSRLKLRRELRLVDWLTHPGFSPDETRIAFVSSRTEGQKQDAAVSHSIVAYETSTLREIFTSELPRPPDSISWAGSQLITSAGGSLYSIEPVTGKASELALKGSSCCGHPLKELCAFAQQNRVSIVRLRDLVPVTVHTVGSSIWCTRWSVDGRTLYVLSSPSESSGPAPNSAECSYQLWTCSLQN